jgi:uncharacterized membrane protein
VDNLSLILHVSAAVLFIGPQVILFFAVIPATWLIKDQRLRRDVTMVITQRFGKLSGFALGILLVTGLYQFYGVVPTAVSDDMMSYRFGMLFMSKMLLFTIVVALVALHVIVAKRVGKLTEAVTADHSCCRRSSCSSRLPSSHLASCSVEANSPTCWANGAHAAGPPAAGTRPRLRRH